MLAVEDTFCDQLRHDSDGPDTDAIVSRRCKIGFAS
jgi:hypothetical protein